jgi:predicted sugar kinase
MVIELGAPASLPLGLVQVAEAGVGKTCLLGITLQHPPVYLFCRAARRLQITGARADCAYRHARRFLSSWQGHSGAEVQIELAIPAFMGLGSDALLGLSVARGLSWLHGMPDNDTPTLTQALDLAPAHMLEICGFDRGGLLLVDTQAALAGQPLPVVRRHEITHPEQKAWAFVFHFPRVTPDISPLLEQTRLNTLVNAAPYLNAMDDSSSNIVNDMLWPAVQQNDLRTFARALMTVQQGNQAALERAGTPQPFTAEEQAILDTMRDGGALAWGRSAGGLALYGLVEGATASRALRRRLRHQVGRYGGRVMATITDNDGARQVIR